MVWREPSSGLGIELLAFWTVTPEHSWLTRYLLPFVSCPTQEVSPGRAAPQQGRGERQEEVLGFQGPLSGPSDGFPGRLRAQPDSAHLR